MTPPLPYTHDTPGRHADLADDPETAALAYGQDFREPRYRREVFLRFWQFHLAYGTHPGCVYFLLPRLAAAHGWGPEERLWFAFLNGNTQNPVTSLLIFRRFPTPAAAAPGPLKAWFDAEAKRLAFDTDRRHQKYHFPEAVACYRRLTADRQAEYFARLAAADPAANFRRLWAEVTGGFAHFGRLSAFSYLEYLRVSGVPVDCDRLFLDDLAGSKSHRNGLAKVLGRDDLDWHASNPTGFAGRYAPGVMGWLVEEGRDLLAAARRRFAAEPFAADVTYFTMESALCTYKSWHRPNRRYPNVYADMLRDRVAAAQRVNPGADLDVFRAARREALPTHLRVEDCPGDPGVAPAKQNHYRLTGQVVMMDREWPCFRNDFNDRLAAARSSSPPG